MPEVKGKARRRAVATEQPKNKKSLAYRKAHHLRVGSSIQVLMRTEEFNENIQIPVPIIYQKAFVMSSIKPVNSRAPE